MPININLLAETQAAEEMRRKDPVRYAIYCSVGVILIVILWICMNQMLISGKTKEISGLNSSWERMKPQYNLIQSNLAYLNELQNQLNQLTTQDKMPTDLFITSLLSSAAYIIISTALGSLIFRRAELK